MHPNPAPIRPGIIRRAALIGAAAGLALPSAFPSASLLESFQKEVDPILDSYCYDCHGFGTSKGGVTLDEFSAENIRDHELWMRVLKNARAHVMPPLEEAIPTDAERARLLDWIKTGPFSIDPANPDPGKTTVQRLNRFEYQNTVRDLMGVEFDTVEYFPADSSGEGFDNIGEILTLSPMLLEKYLDAANHIVSEAVPTIPRVLPEKVIEGAELVRLFSPPANDEDKSKDALQLSFYAPSERVGRIPVPVSEKYQVVLNLKPVSFSSFSGFDYNRCRLVFKIDGATRLEQEFEFISGKEYEFKFDCDWPAGEHAFSFEVVPTTDDPERPKKLKMRIDRITIRGPSGPEFWTRPKNYQTFFPGEVPTDPSQLSRYTRELLGKFASRAFRRPADADTVERLALLAETISEQPGFTYEMGMSQAMVAVLASPRFIFREEAPSPESASAEHPLIDEFSLASRLSYFLWSTMPDETLFRLAEAGQLRANLPSQVERMMADKRSENFIYNFAGQWLHARDIESVNISSIDVWLRDYPDRETWAAKKEYDILREIPEATRTPEQNEAYARTRKIMVALYRSDDRPEWKSGLQRDMRQETELYFDHVIRQDRSLGELLDSDYTFLNERLAAHYGLPEVKGKEMRKVQLEPGSPRGGVLTHGTILAYTSNPTRTSPVKRGVFVLENILGTPPAAPPPNIPSLEDVASAEEIEAMTLRETLAIHREDALCSSCHNRMDPLGLALENFNAMGQWRDAELFMPIQPEGVLITGETFNTIQEMKSILANERIQDFYYCFSEKLLTYALGRGLEYYDVGTVDHLVATLKKSGGRPSALVQAVVESVPFQKRRNPNSKAQTDHDTPQS